MFSCLQILEASLWFVYITIRHVKLIILTLSVSVEFGLLCFFFFQAEDGIRDYKVTGVQTCALPISGSGPRYPAAPPPRGSPARSPAVRRPLPDRCTAAAPRARDRRRTRAPPARTPAARAAARSVRSSAPAKSPSSPLTAPALALSNKKGPQGPPKSKKPRRGLSDHTSLGGATRPNLAHRATPATRPRAACSPWGRAFYRKSGRPGNRAPRAPSGRHRHPGYLHPGPV